MAIKIQSGIPFPTKPVVMKGLTGELRQLAAANVGDSAFFEKPADIDLSKWANRISSSCTNIGGGWWTYAKTKEAPDQESPEVEGIRVWKRADVASKS